MRVKDVGRWLAYDTEDIVYSDMYTFGTPGNYTYRCKAELTREYRGHMCQEPHRVSIRSGCCYGKTLAELERNSQQAIMEAWQRYHTQSCHRTYADTMWM